jgi:hypothetical protein
MRLSVTILSLAVSFLPSLAEAQESYRFEAFGSIGAAKYDASKDHNFNFGGGLGVRPFSNGFLLRGVGFEFEADRTSGQSNLTLPARTTATGDVLYYFSFNRAEPYVFIGMGGSTLGCYGLNLGCDRGIRVGTGGIGVRIPLHNRVSMRPEFRILEPTGTNACVLGPGGCAKHFYRASFGIGYNWR